MGLDYQDVLNRMLSAGRLTNSSQLAKVLGITPQALSNYKKRGGIPTSLLFRFASIYDVSVDWLITGEGAAFKAAERSAGYGDEAAIDLTGLSPDEIIYIGKLLKVLRRPEKFTAMAVKVSIDAFFAVAYPAEK